MWLARRQRAAAILHTVLHLAVVVGVVDLLLQLSGVAAGDPWMRAVLGGAVGALLGPLVVAVYLWIADHFRVNSNELYAGCANEAYKNFLRLHVDRTGLTVYPIGVRLPPSWTFGSDAPEQAPGDPIERGNWAGQPWYRPQGAVEPELIERLVAEHEVLVTVEENVLAGGFGSAVLEHLADSDLLGRTRVLRFGLPDRYVTHGKPALLREEVGLTAGDVAERVAQAVLEPSLA